MGGFFKTFAFFKLLDVRGFADAYAGYGVIAGAAGLSGFQPTVTNAVISS